MKVMNAAVIGCGNIHVCHVDAIKNNPLVNLKTIVDIDHNKVKALAHEYGCQYSVNYKDVLLDEEIDVVHICTPHYLHKDMIIDALRSGKNVFAEKPVSLNLTQSEEIKQVICQVDSKLGVCYQNRLNYSSLKIKSILEQGELGNIQCIKAILTWSRNKSYYLDSGWRGRFKTEGGSLLINQAIHTLDLIQWFGGGVQEIKGVVDSSFLASYIEAEDTAMINMKLKNGARAIFFGSNCLTDNAPLFLEIYCEKGTLRLINNELWLEQNGINSSIVNDTSFDCLSPHNYWGIQHKEMINNFYKFINGDNSASIVDIYEAEKSLAIVEGTYQSSRMRNWISI